MQNHFRQSFESSPESRGSQTSGVLLVLFVQAKSTKNRSLLLGAPRFCKPRTSTPQPQICTATIKTFFRKIRGFPNLESAHPNNNSAQTKLNPFPYFLLGTKSMTKKPLPRSGQHAPRAFRRLRRHHKKERTLFVYESQRSRCAVLEQRIQKR